MAIHIYKVLPYFVIILLKYTYLPIELGYMGLAGGEVATPPPPPPPPPPAGDLPKLP